MKYRIKKSIASGYVNAPPSKSMAHRMLICAALSGDTCIVHGISESEDMLATLDCLEALGAKCEREGESVKVRGIDFEGIESKSALKCRESGSTLRFFIPICLLLDKEVRLSGAPRLLQRPQGVYKEICDAHGMTFIQNEDSIRVRGPLKSGIYLLPGDVSSQFISGLMFALPLVDGDSLIKITTPIESKSYINMTIDALAIFGVEIRWQKDNEIYIKGNQRYEAKEVRVEGDYSNAAFFEALNVFGGSVKVGNLREESIQGDRVFFDMFNKIKMGRPTLDISDCPDLGPILFTLAAANNGAVFTGTRRLKIKESDRGQAMAMELAKFGVKVDILGDKIEVRSSGLHPPMEKIYGHNDHRIVMANAILLTMTGGVIDGAEAVSKSFPDFFEKLAELGIEVQEIDN